LSTFRDQDRLEADGLNDVYSTFYGQRKNPQEIAMQTAAFDAEVHHAFIDRLRRTGGAPSRHEVSAALARPVDEIEQALRRLSASHGVVLHPHVCEPWVIHPFSLSPTATWVQHGEQGWWAPCIWCGFGIAALVGRNVVIHARIGGEAEDVDIHIVNGEVVDKNLWVHFAVPPRAAWDNVQHFCATVLPFRQAADVQTWSSRHGIPVGSAVPISQVQELGREWYGHHCDRHWRKWSVAEAIAIFERVGLTGPFWSLESREGSF
jgi:hypothetical protein